MATVAAVTAIVGVIGLGIGVASHVSGQHQYEESQAYNAESLKMAEDAAALERQQYLHSLESERAAAQARARAAGYNAGKAKQDMASTILDKGYALSTYDEMIEDFNVAQRAAIGASGFKLTEGTTPADILEDTAAAQEAERGQLGREYDEQYEYFEGEKEFWEEEEKIEDENSAPIGAPTEDLDPGHTLYTDPEGNEWIYNEDEEWEEWEGERPESPEPEPEPEPEEEPEVTHRVGDKKRENGHTYIWNGSQWVRE